MSKCPDVLLIRQVSATKYTWSVDDHPFGSGILSVYLERLLRRLWASFHQGKQSSSINISQCRGGTQYSSTRFEDTEHRVYVSSTFAFHRSVRSLSQRFYY
jgi:hypothetical protein